MLEVLQRAGGQLGSCCGHRDSDSSVLPACVEWQPHIERSDMQRVRICQNVSGCEREGCELEGKLLIEGVVCGVARDLIRKSAILGVMRCYAVILMNYTPDVWCACLLFGSCVNSVCLSVRLHS